MSQQAGWYDDPQDDSNLRYWDGVQWTDHTSPKQKPGLDRAGLAVGADVAAVEALVDPERALGLLGGQGRVGAAVGDALGIGPGLAARVDRAHHDAVAAVVDDGGAEAQPPTHVTERVIAHHRDVSQRLAEVGPQRGELAGTHWTLPLQLGDPGAQPGHGQEQHDDEDDRDEDEEPEEEPEGLRRRGSGKRPAGLDRRGSYGTTRASSPSFRRRSVESTMAHIKDTLDGDQVAEDNATVARLAEQLSRVWISPHGSSRLPRSTV